MAVRVPNDEAWVRRKTGHGLYWKDLIFVPPGTGPDKRPRDWENPTKWCRVPMLDAQIIDPTRNNIDQS
jgi:hypothetical protein